MIIKFKEGSERKVGFNPHLAARLLNLGHSVDYDLESTPEQRKHEQREIQKQYDWILEREAMGKRY